MRGALPVLTVALLFASVASAFAATAAGDLDPSFGNDGKATTEFGRENSSVVSAAVDGNGRVVVGGLAGSPSKSVFALAR
jgi:hypothetical protein